MGALSTEAVARGTLARYGALLTRYLLPLRAKVVLLALLLLGDPALRLVNPRILSRFIDMARGGGSSAALATLAVVFLVIVFVTQAVAGMATYVSQDVGWSATNLLRADLVRHCLDLDQSFHRAHPPGDLIVRVDGDIALLSNFLSAFVIRVLGNLLLLVGIIALIAHEDWRMGAALAGYTVGAVWVLHRARKLVVPSFMASRRAAAALSSFWEEILSGREDIQSSGAVAYVRGEQERLLLTFGRDGRGAMVMGRAFQSVLEGLTAGGTALVFALGAYLLGGGTITIGTVFLVFYYMTMVTAGLGDLTEQLNDAQSATAGIARIYELLDTAPTITDGPGAAPAPGPFSITFRDVTFGYDSDVPVLHNLTLRVETGHVLGVLGQTGSGKTTLARLLLRFHDPDRGAILLDDVDIHDMRLSELRRRIGMVTQEVQIFEATVRDNLTFFGRDVLDDRLVSAFDALGLAEWYRGLPSGLDTPISPGQLSAGEAQLLALTRVFLLDPDLVVLDEASSRLDPATAHLLETALDRLLHGKTGIIIAHQLTSVRQVDQILILDDGRIAEYGERAVLVADPTSRFARLLHAGLWEAQT